MGHPLDDLDLLTIELFLAANELGSISKAARRHHLSQPVASRKLRDLERRLGFDVLHRTATGVTLSPRGSRFLHMAHQLLTNARRFREEVDQLAAGDDGVVLAVTTNVARHDLPRIASEIASDRDAAAPATVRITVMPTLDICRALRNDEADLGLIDGPRAPVGLSSEILSRHELLTIVSPQHPWADRASISPEELAAAPLLLPAAGSGTRDVIDDALQACGVPTVGEPLLAADTDQRIALAIFGTGAAIVRSRAVANHLAASRLIAVDVGELFTQPIRIAWKGKRPNRQIADVIERVRSSAASPEGAD